MNFGLFNKDNSFFDISSPDIKLDGRVINQDVISLDISEELNAIDTGTLQLRDANHYYSRVFRTGATLNISWGYKNAGVNNLSPVDIYKSDIFSKNLERRGLKVMVNSPSGSGGENGEILYNINFMALDMRGEKTNFRTFSGTKRDFVNAIFDRLGVVDRDINFQRANDVVTEDTAILQYESDFKTLVRYSFEWKAKFKLGYSSNGDLFGFFLDPWLVSSSKLLKKITGIQTNVFFAYGGGDWEEKKDVANVISYDWNDNSGESGAGHNVQMRIVDGKPIFIKYNAGTETVRAYRLNENRVREEMDKRGDIVSKSQLIAEWLNVSDFKQIERFFDPIDSSTAPQGTGIIAKIKTIGSPIYTVGLEADFGYGFPDSIGRKGIVTYFRKVNHNISEKGYFSTIETADSYVFSATGERLS